jgi:S1-C subfamily serine protease
VEGEACGRLQEGSGFVVLDDLVATNAHVVAGQRSTLLVLRSGRRVPATVVHFDPDRDLALLRADLDLAPLPVADGDEDASGAVLGYPGGGPLEVSPFAVREEVDATGRDLYDDHRIERRVLILAADLRAGDSGAALVDASGTVVGVAFAIAPDRPGTAYALDTSELDEALAAPRDGRVSTGECL